MAVCRWYWAGSAALAAAGLGVTVANFEWEDPWLMVGLAAMVVACTVANTGFVVLRSRSMDEEFEVGYRVGYRAGRRRPKLVGVTSIHTARQGFQAFDKAVQHGRLPKASVGSLPSHGSASRRPETHPH